MFELVDNFFRLFKILSGHFRDCKWNFRACTQSIIYVELFQFFMIFTEIAEKFWLFIKGLAQITFK